MGVAVGARRPAVDLLTNCGRVAYPNSGVPSWEDARDDWTVGIGLRVPIFNGGALRADNRRRRGGGGGGAGHARSDAQARVARDPRRLRTPRHRDRDLAGERGNGRAGAPRLRHRRGALSPREGISTQLELDNFRLLLVQAQGDRALAARDLEVDRAGRALLPNCRSVALSLSRPAGRSVGHGYRSQDLVGFDPVAGFGRRLSRLGRSVDGRLREGRQPQVAAAPPPVMLSLAENLATVGLARLESGPVLSGSLAADREATVRAEVAGSVTEIHAEEGQRVERGAVLARIERHGPAGARVVIPILRAFREPAGRGRGAQRPPRRGAPRDRRSAAPRSRRGPPAVAQAEAVLADAQARRALAGEQLAKSTVRSPFAGVVSRRGVKAGDTVTPGTELFTVVDPTQLRLEAAVPSERFAELTLGAPVTLRPSGGNAAYSGSIDRINPVADPVTRQISVYAKVPNADGRLVSGLFVEGRVATQAREVPSLPRAAIDRSGTTTTVMALRGGKVERVTVTLGLEDEVAELVEIAAGLRVGDQVLVGPARSGRRCRRRSSASTGADCVAGGSTARDEGGPSARPRRPGPGRSRSRCRRGRGRRTCAPRRSPRALSARCRARGSPPPSRRGRRP